MSAPTSFPASSCVSICLFAIGARLFRAPNNSLKPWEISRIPVKSSGTNGLRLTPWEERRGPSAGGLGLRGCLPPPRRGIA